MLKFMDTLFFKLLCTTPVTREGINITNLFHKHWQHQDFRKCRQATVLKRVLIFTRPRYTWGPIYGSGCRGLGRLGYRKKTPCSWVDSQVPGLRKFFGLHQKITILGDKLKLCCGNRWTPPPRRAFSPFSPKRKIVSVKIDQISPPPFL